MDEQITSEEKLLKLIRKKPQASKEIKPATGKGKTKSLTSPFSSVRFLYGANRFLLVACVLVALLFFARVWIFLRSQGDNQVAWEDKETVSVEGESTKIELGQRNPINYYEQIIEARDIFMAPWEKPQTQAAQPGSVAVPLSNLNQEFRLIGILLDRDPKAILEDLKTQQTVFMSKGESLRGAQLDDIRSDKVIFNYNGQKVEMTQQ